MPNQEHTVTKEKLKLRIKAVSANIEEVPHLKEPLARAEVVVNLLDDLSAQQASLTADRQGVTKQIAETVSEGQKLLVFLDAGIRHRYGSRSEKLVEFGQQPFRSKPRVRQVGPDGKPLKRNARAAAPDPAAPESPEKP